MSLQAAEGGAAIPSNVMAESDEMSFRPKGEILHQCRGKISRRVAARNDMRAAFFSLFSNFLASQQC